MGIPTCAQVVHRENPLLKDPTNADNVQPGKVPYGFFDVSGGGKRVPSLIEGNIYLYLFVDSYSRKYFPYYSKKKDEKDTLRIMKQRFKENVIGVINEDVGNEVLMNQVISIQGDNGELKSKVVKSYLMKSGIISRYTQPHHPEQNGMPERAFRTIYELAVSMLVHAGLPEPYWQFATEFACFVSDITPNQTPDGFAREAYYKWYDKVFDYSKLRAFGSRTYVMSHHVVDMGNRAEEGILVGFESNFRPTYTYKIHLPHKNAKVCSGDVNICEHVGRAEPERLLPPIIELQHKGETLDVEKYQR